jgi:hypothetical protein
MRVLSLASCRIPDAAAEAGTSAQNFCMKLLLIDSAPDLRPGVRAGAPRDRA